MCREDTAARVVGEALRDVLKPASVPTLLALRLLVDVSADLMVVFSRKYSSYGDTCSTVPHAFAEQSRVS